jgi:hypothetical protein
MGKKWLGIAALALIAILIVMWQQLDKSEATPAPAPVQVARAAQPMPAAAPAAVAAAPSDEAAAAPADTKSEKYDPQSDEFFFKHDEVVIPNVMRSAVKCWEALEPAKQQLFNRNQSIVIKFKQKIVNGTVTMYDAKIDRSSIKDPALESCFFSQVLATTWHDDKLPDWEQEDEVKISPRVLKKYTRANIDYVGAEAPPTPTYVSREQLKADAPKTDTSNY